MLALVCQTRLCRCPVKGADLCRWRPPSKSLTSPLMHKSAMPSTESAPPAKSPSSTTALFPTVPVSKCGCAIVSRLSWSEVQVKDAPSGPKAAARARFAVWINSESLKLQSVT